jgi:hypothetical protein
MFNFDTRSAVSNLIIINVLFFVVSYISEVAFGINLNRTLGLYYFDRLRLCPAVTYTHVYAWWIAAHFFQHVRAFFVWHNARKSVGFTAFFNFLFSYRFWCRVTASWRKRLASLQSCGQHLCYRSAVDDF